MVMVIIGSVWAGRVATDAMKNGMGRRRYKRYKKYRRNREYRRYRY